MTMASDGAIVGFWLNDIPDSIMNEDDSVREISNVILQGFHAQKIVVADRALLITMMKNQRVPQTLTESIARDLRSFLERKSIPLNVINGVTLSRYIDTDKWEMVKERILTALNSEEQESWDSKPLEEWSVDDSLLWLRDKNLGKYCNSFKDNDMTGQNMLELNEVDLMDLGIRSIGHRKAFMRHLNEAKKYKLECAVQRPPPTNEVPIGDKLCPKFEKPLQLEHTNELAYKSVLVGGLSESLLEDEDSLFDIENLAFAGCTLESFKPIEEGILVTFESPLTTTGRNQLKDEFILVLKRLKLDCEVENGLTIDFWENGKVVSSAASPKAIEDEKSAKPINVVQVKEEKAPPPPKKINYWTEFWEKLTTNGDVEDFFDDVDSRLNLRGAREVLATVRDVKLKEVKKDDPGIKHLKGQCQADIKNTLSDCLVEVMHEIENIQLKAEKSSAESESTQLPKLDPFTQVQDTGIYVGMNVQGLPRSITDDDNTVSGIQRLVFKDIPVKRFTVIDDRDPPTLKVEFHKFIVKEKIPELCRNLKNFLKAVNVDQKVVQDVTIAFFEDKNMERPKAESNPKARVLPGHKRRETDDFLVAPGDTVDVTKSFTIEGIPEKYLNKESFLQDMPDKVFAGIDLEAISVPAATKKIDGSISQTSLEIRFKQQLNIQKLPMIAMKLKRFLKGQEIPPHIVNQVTLQVRHEETAPTMSELESNPVVGLIFSGIPKQVLESNWTLYAMESEVLTTKHPVRLMEPNESNKMLRITVESPINSKQDLTAIAQRLKKFLAKQKVSQSIVNDVLVMSFDQEKWERHLPKDTLPNYDRKYVGIEIENMPTKIVDSDKQLEEIGRKVFADLKVVNMNILDSTLRIAFGVGADTKAIEKVAKELKRFLSQLKFPIEQINKIVIVPHTVETWKS